ncbi:MAG: hypothetical protein CIT01_03845 [Methanobacterium sp. BRmetb2]|nr:MAG: hypothetical protein CIT01_03845 [Methanobacterium sp. BRmetb2]
MILRKVASTIMGELEAFEGSRPALDASNILIVRGMSRKKIAAHDMAKVLSKLLKKLGAKEVDVFSDEATDVIGIMDERIRNNVEIQGETDVYGIYRLKESLEAMNCDVEYSLGIMDNAGIFIVMWADKSGIGPRFVEVVVASVE